MITQSGWVKIPEVDEKKPIFSIKGNSDSFVASYNVGGDYAMVISPIIVAGEYRYKYFEAEDGYYIKGNIQYVLGGKNFDLRIGQIKKERAKKLIGKTVQFIKETI